MNLAASLVTLVAAFAVSIVTATALFPLFRSHALARPNARSSHREPTPQGGGVAVVAATIVISLAMATMADMPKQIFVQLCMIASAATFIAFVGAIDDIRTMPVLPRIIAQVIAAALVLATLPDVLRIVSFLPWWVERALLLIVLVWIVNLTNFMDGIDWMTVVEIVPVSAGLVLLGWLGALPSAAVLVSLSLLGAMLGFAPYNKPIARLFLGDVGSLPIGLITGWLLILLAGQGHIAAALLLPLYYFADATITLLRRLIRGERFWHAHRGHFYQRALDGGVGIGAILTRVFATNIALAILAALSVWANSAYASAAALLCGIALVACLLFNFNRRSE